MSYKTLTVSGNWTLASSTPVTTFAVQARPATPRRVAGGPFNATTEDHWSTDPVNGASSAHGSEGLMLSPASAGFADRAQVYQSFATVPGARYTATVEADQIAGAVQAMIFNATGAVTLIGSAAIAVPGTVNFGFTATGSVTRLYLRVDGTDLSARFVRAHVDVDPGDAGLHRHSLPPPPGRLFVGRGTGTTPPASSGLVQTDPGANAPFVYTLAGIGQGESGDRLWCRWDGPTEAEVWCSSWG